MIRIMLTTHGLKEAQTVIANLIKNTEAELQDLGDQTALKMKEIISSSKVRPQAGEPTKLENAIEKEQLPDGWGVGNIAKLNQEAPGWRAINYGSDHMVGKHLPQGTFQPGLPIPDGGSFREGRWKKGLNQGGSRYSPIVTKPISPMNYIDRTVNWLKNYFTTLGSKITKGI